MTKLQFKKKAQIALRYGKAKILHDDGMVEVIAVYEHSKLKYTRTVIRDPDGWVEKTIIVNADGTYGIV